MINTMTSTSLVNLADVVVTWSKGMVSLGLS